MRESETVPEHQPTKTDEDPRPRTPIRSDRPQQLPCPYLLPLTNPLASSPCSPLAFLSSPLVGLDTLLPLSFLPISPPSSSSSVDNRNCCCVNDDDCGDDEVARSLWIVRMYGRGESWTLVGSTSLS